MPLAVQGDPADCSSTVEGEGKEMASAHTKETPHISAHADTCEVISYLKAPKGDHWEGGEGSGTRLAHPL